MDQICVKLYSSNPHLCDEVVALLNLDEHFPPLPAYVPLTIPTVPAATKVTAKYIKQRNNVEKIKKKAEVIKDVEFVDYVDKNGNYRCHNTRGELYYNSNESFTTTVMSKVSRHLSEELVDVPMVAMPVDIDNIPFDLLLGDDIGSLLLGDDIDVNGMLDFMTTNSGNKEKNVNYSVADLWDIVENQKLMMPFSKTLFPMHLLDLCPNDYESLRAMPASEQLDIAPIPDSSSIPMTTNNFFYSRILGCMLTPKTEKKFKRKSNQNDANVYKCSYIDPSVVENFNKSKANIYRELYTSGILRISDRPSESTSATIAKDLSKLEQQFMVNRGDDEISSLSRGYVEQLHQLELELNLKYAKLRKHLQSEEIANEYQVYKARGDRDRQVLNKYKAKVGKRKGHTGGNSCNVSGYSGSSGLSDSQYSFDELVFEDSVAYSKKRKS